MDLLQLLLLSLYTDILLLHQLLVPQYVLYCVLAWNLVRF
jgi:hypothetical protein